MRRAGFVTGVAALMCVLAVSYAFARYSNSRSPIPAPIHNSVSFKLYYPSVLPSGYELDRSSFSSVNGIVTYYASSSDGSNIVFTLQHRPDNFDFAAFYKEGLKDSSQFTTPLGQAATGKVANKPFGNLLAGDTWVLLSTSSAALSTDDFTRVLRGLKQS